MGPGSSSSLRWKCLVQAESWALSMTEQEHLGAQGCPCWTRCHCGPCHLPEYLESDSDASGNMWGSCRQRDIEDAACPLPLSQHDIPLPSLSTSSHGSHRAVQTEHLGSGLRCVLPASTCARDHRVGEVCEPGKPKSQAQLCPKEDLFRGGRWGW